MEENVQGLLQRTRQSTQCPSQPPVLFEPFASSYQIEVILGGFLRKYLGGYLCQRLIDALLQARFCRSNLGLVRFIDCLHLQ